MNIKFIFYLTVFTLILQSCSVTKELSTINLSEGQQISYIVLINGKEIDFTDDPLGYAIFTNNKIESFSKNGNLFYYDINSIQKIYFKEKTDNTSLLLGGAFLSLLLSFLVIIY